MKHLILTILISITLISKVNSQSEVYVEFIMWTTGSVEMWDNETIPLWGFSEGFTSPTLPGPTVYATEGDSVFILVRNQSQTPHTIHLHGLDVNQANDGVPQLSQQLNHSDEITYSFKATHAGTYLYHCHVASIVHVQMGMYGNVIVKAKDNKNEAWTNGPEFDSEKAWLISEFDKSWHDSVPVHTTGDSIHAEFMVPDYNPDYFLVNGKSEQQLQDSSTALFGSKNEKIYCRISNIGYLGNQIIFPSELNAEILSSDGRPLPNKIINDTLFMTPGERYGIMISSTIDLSTNVIVNFTDLDNSSVTNTQNIPVTISGTYGVNQDIINNIKIFPNPTTDKLQIQSTETAELNYKIYNTTGAIMLQSKFMKSAEIETSNWQNGIYLLKIIDRDGVNIKTEKLIIK